jgi:hypothetical protein
MLTMKLVALISLAAVFVAAPLAPATAALTTPEIRETLYDFSAKACIYHSKARVEPMLASLADSTLALVEKRHIILCPNTKLPEDSPIVWYGSHLAMTWNPDIKDATATTVKKLDAMIAADELPADDTVWTAAGDAVPGSVVPGLDYAVRANIEYP